MSRARGFCAVIAVLLCASVFSLAAAPAMPKIIAHRGESYARPENTMAAFRLAFERGIDAVECDVQVTSDNVPVIIHDDTTKRTAGSSYNYTVASTPWDTLKDVRVTAFTANGNNWATSEWAEETIPLFSDYLDLLNLNETTVAVVELKANSSALITAVTNAVAEAIAAGTPATKDRVVFISFYTAMVSQIRDALPEYEAWYICNAAPGTAASAISTLSGCNATGIDVNYSSGGYNAAYIETLANAGYEFAIWTCDNINDAYAQTSMGVKYITTNVAKTMADGLAGRIAEAANWDEIYDSGKARGATRWDVDSYVTDSLIAHFDGIRNAGADKPHDPHAGNWANLVDGTNPFSFHYNKEYTASDNWYRGGWLGDAFNFGGQVYAYLDSAITLGSRFTVQVATTLKPGEQLCNNSTPKSPYPAIFAASDDSFSIYFNNSQNNTRTSTITLKANNYNGLSTRATANLSSGEYITAVIDTTGAKKTYFTTNTLLGAGTANSKNVAVGSYRYYLGGTSDNNHYLVGSVHSVRVYSKVLSDAELEQNRMVDEIRFRGRGVNVIVESSMPGIEATESNGLYTVNGTHVFTAPSSVTDSEGREWTPSGYRLEIFDSFSNTWSRAEFHAGASFAYTNCLARPKVRITWDWTMASGVLEYDASLYVPNGLWLHFDAIRNEGLGRPHNSSATVWTNLSAIVGGEVFELVKSSKPAGAWKEKAYRFNGGSYQLMNQQFMPPKQSTVDIAVDMSFPEQVVNNYSCPCFFCGLYDDQYSIFTRYDSMLDTLRFKTDNLTGGSARSAMPSWEGRHITALCDYTAQAIGDGTNLTAWTIGSNATPGNIGRFHPRFGGAYNTWTGQGYLHETVCDYYALRFYDRILSNEEILRNREIDNIRYYGAWGESIQTNLVVVRASRGGSGCETGGWLIRGAGVSRTFAAPQGFIDGSGYSWTLQGYRLETWDAEKRQIGETVEVLDGTASVTLSQTASGANRRLTWIYEMTKGLKTVADYSPADYVQNGLVLQYDGEFNDGADRPHLRTDNSHWTKPRWKDLSASANDGRFLSTSYHSWYDKGCYFNNGSGTSGTAVWTTRGVTPGASFTVQMALDAPSSQAVDYPNLFAMPGDSAMYLEGNSKSHLLWKLKAFGGPANYTQIPNGSFKRKNVTGIVTPTSTILTQTAAYDVIDNTSVSVPGAQTWSVFGAATSDKLDSRYAKGECKAFRLYSRALGENELAQNLKVDDIRFRGAVVTNVVVASDAGEGNETNGVYEVFGDWTFTAGNGGGLVYNTIETVADGAFAPQSMNFTNAYTHSQSDGPVRLSWKSREDNGISVSGTLNADGTGSLVFAGTILGDAMPEGTNITLFAANAFVAGLPGINPTLDCSGLSWENGRRVARCTISAGEGGSLNLGVYPSGLVLSVR